MAFRPLPVPSPRKYSCGMRFAALFALALACPADDAARLLRVWFLAPETRMNPNLRFAQAVAGKNDGRGTGILESRYLGDIADASGLLAGSAAWSAQQLTSKTLEVQLIDDFVFQDKYASYSKPPRSSPGVAYCAGMRRSVCGSLAR